MDHDKSNDGYAGVSPATSGLGKATLYGLFISVPVTIASYFGAFATRSGVYTAAAFAGLGAWGLGFFKGIDQGARAEAQHASLVNENRQLKRQINSLTQGVETLAAGKWSAREQNPDQTFAEKSKSGDIPPTHSL